MTHYHSESLGSLENGGNGRRYSRAAACALLACLSFASGCSSTGGAAEPDGSIRGELHIYRIDYLDGHSEQQFFLASDADSPERRLSFATDPGLQPWTKLKVWGTETTDGVRVERYQEQSEAVSDGVQVSAEALVAPTKKTRTVGFVLMDVGNGVNLTMDNANTAIFGVRTPAQAGLNQFYNENSYGGFNFTGDILGPQTVTTLGTCQQSAINTIEKAWPTTFGKTYDHWMQYIGSNYTSCGWGGIGGEGTAARPASGSWYNGGNSCTVLNQEVGHNLGLMHSNSITCGTAPFADDPQTCMGAEYGDRHTVMGSGCAHFGAYEKWYEGFFGGCNAVRATVTGTYTLLPTELPCDGVQALQIPMPKTRPFHNTTGTATVVNLSKYYLELRTKVGIDGKETGPAVLVTVGGDVPASNRTSEFTWVLDMDPTSPKTAEGMTAGKSFTDPAGGVSFTVQDVDATHATINVTVAASTGPATCLDGTAFTGPGPQSCGTTAPAGGGGTGGVAGAGGSSAVGGAAGRAGAGGMAAASGGSGGSTNGGTGGVSTSPGGAAGSSGTGTAGAFSAGGSGGAGGSFAAAGTSAAGSAAAGASSSNAGASSHPSSSADSSGCSCRTAPTSPSRSGLAALGALVLGYALRRRRRANSGRNSWVALGVSIAASALGCSSRSDASTGKQTAANYAAPTADAGDCAERAEGVSLGLNKVSSGGYSFTLSALDPEDPVQSSGPPGNTWTVSVADANGAPVTGAVLQVSSFMPDHGHYTPSAVAVERGGGAYEVEGLILPMPGLYAITLGLTLAGGEKESVALSLCLATSS